MLEIAKTCGPVALSVIRREVIALAASVPDVENIDRFAFHREYQPVNMRPASIE